MKTPSSSDSRVGHVRRAWARLFAPREGKGAPWRVGNGTTALATVIVATYLLEVAIAWRHGVLGELLWHGEAATKWLRLFKVGPVWPDYGFMLVPHMFAHGALLGHFLFNLVMVVIAAPSVEGRLGTTGMWVVFIAVGMFSGALQSSLTGAWSWGASGPAMTFFAVWFLLDSRGQGQRAWKKLDRFPRVTQNYWVKAAIEPYRHGWVWWLFSWGSLALVAAYSWVGIGSGDGVGHVAHLIGLLAGILLAIVLQAHDRARIGTRAPPELAAR